MSTQDNMRLDRADLFRSSDQSAATVPAIEVRDVKLSFDDIKVLNGVSFFVREGETKIILGESASGKTVLIKLIAGLIRPDSGKIFVEGREITALSEDQLMPIRKNIGVVFQETALFDSLSVFENVAYRLYEEGGHTEEEMEHQVRQALGFVGLEDAIFLMPSDLSGGMRRRVALARALITKPKIILYDEPTAGLDPLTARTIVELILKLRDREGASSVFVTHRLTDAFALASERVAAVGSGVESGSMDSRETKSSNLNTSFVVLKDGRVMFEGSEEELLRTKRTVPFLQEFLS
jgi:phospholipid/cholesterol/gamma-HCH transport system ATP-binding protein